MKRKIIYSILMSIVCIGLMAGCDVEDKPAGTVSSGNVNIEDNEVDEKNETEIRLSAPVLNEPENVNGGVRVSWEAVSGAEKYRVFRRQKGEKWKKIADTEKLKITDKHAESGNTYIYTVRCISADSKKYTSEHDNVGKTIKYIAAPVLKSISAEYEGARIGWEDSAGAVKYRVYRKKDDEKWTKVGDTTETEFLDKTVESGNTYIYTVRCITKNGKKHTSGYDNTGLTIDY